MKLTSFGHSAFRLEIAGTRLVFDPLLVGNPHGAVALSAVPCEYVLCSHAHDDHIADAVELALLHNATIVAPFELAEYFSALGPKTIDLMPGGGIDLPWGRIDMTHAEHSSSIERPNGKNEAMGVACGYVVRARGQSLYHAGDTALFSDMAAIGRGGLDVALVPIGDRYTMGTADAVTSLGLLRPKVTVPMHYNTTEKIQADPHAFAKAAGLAGFAARVLQPGETVEI